MNKKRVIAWLLWISALLLIFFFSSQNGTASSGFSNGLLKTLEDLFHIPLSSPIFSYLIRKFSHFTEFLWLGLWTSYLFSQYRTLHKREILCCLLFCFFYACTDEIHQIFVGGRVASPIDVLIDFSGSAVGIFLGYLWKRKKA